MSTADGGSTRRHSAAVAAGILVSRVTGLVRERAIGHFFGTGSVVDAFTAAFRIPNLLQHLLGEGTLSASFIPVYARLLDEGRDEEAGRVAGAILGLLAVLAGLLTGAGVLLAEPLTAVIAAGFRDRPETFDLTARLVRILFPATGFLVLSAWCLGVLNSHRRFFMSYVAPAVLNVVQVVVLVTVALTTAVSDSSLVTWLAIATVIGGAAQFGVQIPAVTRHVRRVRPSLRTDLPGVRTIARNFGPVVAARGVVQISTFVQVFMASFLAAGALATLRYGQVLYLLPISLFGMSVAAAELPQLSQASAAATEEVVARLERGLARIATFVVPTAVGYLLAGDFVVAMLFQSGEFDRLDALAVWIVLGGFAFGLVASTSARLLQSALYGMGDARTPSRLAVLRVATAIAIGVPLMFQFDRIGVRVDGVVRLGELPALGALPGDVRAETADDVLRLGAAGLSVAATVAAWLEFLLLRRAVGRSIGRVTLGGRRLAPIVIATGASGVVALLLRPVAADLDPLLAGPVVVGGIAVTYAVVGSALGLDDVNAVLRTLHLRRR